MENTSSEETGHLPRMLEYLQSVFEGFPYREIVDQKYFSWLMIDFPGLDIEEELKQYHAWTLDQSNQKKMNHHSRFRSWLKRAVEMRRRSPCQE